VLATVRNPARISTNGLLYIPPGPPGPRGVVGGGGGFGLNVGAAGPGGAPRYGLGGTTGPLFTGCGNIPGRGAVIGTWAGCPC